jgi:MoaA/NifB/PqqE/SkfB family radical SAM enzyme
MNSQLAQFSVYNHLLSRSASLDALLPDLQPADRDRGWQVARNPIKPLNHLDFLRRKEEIAVELDLHNILTSPLRFDQNYTILKKHQARTVSTQDVIEHLARQLYQEGRPLPAGEIATRLQEYATIRHMEFHPSDVCNLTCRGCTYAHDDPERKPLPTNFPFEEIGKIAQLKPRSMVIIGGGEPVLYKNGRHRFQEMVEEVRAAIPGVQLALVTNGTHKPADNWPDGFRWIRLSLDAATPETYLAFRGKPLFRRVIRNYLSYLDHETRYVGLSFLFGRSNVHEYAAVARFVFDLVWREKPQALPKVNIQYRPLRHDPAGRGRCFGQAVSAEQIERIVTEIRELADSSPEMKAFLRDQTNIPAILGGNTHPPHPFSRCYYSQTFRIVRANGDLRPCFVRVTEPDFYLGNIRSDSLETIALNSLYVGARRKPHCDAQGCRQCHVNYTFEQGLRGNLQPSTSAEVLADPMF